MKIVLALLAIGSIPIAAQLPGTEPQSAAQYSSLRGIVVDSVHGGFLKGASVGVLGPSQMGITDSLGRFFIDSIPPGEYRIALFDGFLDSVSLSVVSPPTRFAAGDTIALILAIPSQRAILTAKCGPPTTVGESAALFGRVLRAADGSPIAHASIRVEWLEVTIGEGSGVRTAWRHRAAESNADGRYKICGLPTGLAAEVSAMAGDDTTAAVPIMYGESLLGLATLFLPGPSGAGAGTASAPVRGTVLNIDGAAMAGAVVTLSSSPTSVTTRENGSFEIEGRRLGTQTVLVRKLGYQPVEVVVDVLPQSTAPITVRLDQFVPILQSVVIRARHAAALEQVGYTRRKKFGMGRYYEGDDLQHLNSLRHFLETIPMLRRRIDLPRVTVATGGRSGDPTNVRDAGPGSVGRAASPAEPAGEAQSGACRVIFVDGSRFGGGDFLMGNEIAAIEVYSALMTPAEFKTFSNCPTVLIWTDWRLRRSH